MTSFLRIWLLNKVKSQKQRFRKAKQMYILQFIISFMSTLLGNFGFAS